MKVRLVVSAYLPARGFGGPVAKIERLAPGLQKAGVELTVVTSTLSAPGKSDLPPGLDTSLSVPVYRIRPLATIRWGTLVAWPRDLPPCDLVHVIGAWNGLAYQAMWQCLKEGVPLIWEPAGMLPARGRHVWIKRLLTPLHRWLAARTAAIVWTSNRERLEAPVQVPEDRSIVRPNPAPDLPPRLPEKAEARKALGLPVGETCWGYLGRINQRKGIEAMLDAWKSAAAPSARLAFAGPVELPSLAARIDAAGPSVTRLGALDENRRWDFLRAIDCLVLVPEFGENFGNVVVEAALAGTPAVVSRAVGAAEFFVGDPGVRVIAPHRELIATFVDTGALPSPRGIPEILQPERVAARQMELYRGALQRAGR